MLSVDEFYGRYFSDTTTDKGYLYAHYPRFIETKRRFELSTVAGAARPLRVLDVGAHWLHQSILWRLDGHSVVACDTPSTLRHESVIRLAERNDIRTISYERMDSGSTLAALEDNSFDVVLFCEILEHLTFNPIPFWREVYRVMAPNARIVCTTPNYYWSRGRAWDLPRLTGLMGGGLPVRELLHTPTYGPHWKEFSLKEVVLYFSSLSRDFSIARAEHVPDPRGPWGVDDKRWRSRLARFVENRYPVFHWGLHVEALLREKRAGIEITPAWG